jgi:hypothetical protein
MGPPCQVSERRAQANSQEKGTGPLLSEGPRVPSRRPEGATEWTYGTVSSTGVARAKSLNEQPRTVSICTDLTWCQVHPNLPPMSSTLPVPALAPAEQTACYSPWLKVRVAIRAALTTPWSSVSWAEVRASIPWLLAEERRLRRDG